MGVQHWKNAAKEQDKRTRIVLEAKGHHDPFYKYTNKSIDNKIFITPTFCFIINVHKIIKILDFV